MIIVIERGLFVISIVNNMKQCRYCKTKFFNKEELESHILDLLLYGESDKFCGLMIKQVKLTKWLNQI